MSIFVPTTVQDVHIYAQFQYMNMHIFVQRNISRFDFLYFYTME
jgi:hypothetical protein